MTMLQLREFLRDPIANHVFMTTKAGIATSVSINKEIPVMGFANLRVIRCG
jgi:hypothetical protein